jgi:peptidyl-prolyl cis-trans isomerase SurA
VKVDIVTIWNDSLTSKVHKQLRNGISADSIRSTYKNSTKAQVMISGGVITLDNRRLPSDFELKEGVSRVYDKDGRPTIVVVHEILDPTIKTFKEARPLLENHRQQELDKEWKESLREGRTIEINDRILRKIKKYLAKQV